MDIVNSFIPLNTNSLPSSSHVLRELPDCTGDAGHSRSSSPAWTDDDSIRDEDFDYEAQVALEDQRRRRYGSSSDLVDEDVPPSPARKRPRYREQPPLKPGASTPAPVNRGAHVS